VPDDVVRTVERGQPVRAGDRIETREGGHVHVRFVDGGRLSVRPASRLQIEITATPQRSRKGLPSNSVSMKA
jgi:hypothetical protein